MDVPPNPLNPRDPAELEPSNQAFLDALGAGKNKKYGRFIIAVLGSLPWVGGVLGAAAGLSAENDQGKINDLQRLWLLEHREKISELNSTLKDIFGRLDTFGVEVEARMQAPEYLALVRKTFRAWDEADTQEKKELFKILITNAGAIAVCSDDLVRLFINWLNQYHEAHFRVIREIYKSPGITRGQIWDRIHGTRPREDSAEADLYRYLISELTLGRVVRLHRETTSSGEFVKQTHRGPRGPASSTMESAFEDTKPMELTKLGEQFVQYVLNDAVPRLNSPDIN